MSLSGRRLLVSAGEVSGDRIATEFVKYLRSSQALLEVAGCGGPGLDSVGARLLLNQSRLDFVGWSGPLRHLPRLWLDQRRFLSKAAQWQPDSVLLVDSPGWNRPLLQWAKDRGLPVHWIAPPQLWAWKDRKAPYLEGVSVQPLFAFERPWLECWGARVAWKGYPRQPVPLTREDPILALLPGTRETLWQRHIPLFARAARILGIPAKVAVPMVPSPKFDRLCQTIGLEWELSKTLLARAQGALAVPGTGCLEVVRHGIPLVAAAHPGWIDRTLAARLLSDGSRILPNRILGRTLVEEFYLEAAHPESLASSLETAMSRNREFVEAREELEERLGPSRFS